MLAQAQPWPAGLAGPAYLRDVRRTGRRFRRRHRHGLALRERDRGPAGGPFPGAAPRTGAGDKGRARLRGDRWHVNRDRPGRRGPAVLLRQAPLPRHEPPGHLRPRRRDPVGLRAPARCRARPDRGPDPGLLRELAASGQVVLADKGYAGAGDHVRIPYPGRGKPASHKDANRAHAQPRSPGERANAQLKTWRILRKLRCCPWQAGQLAKAIHVLRHRPLDLAGHRGGRPAGPRTRRASSEPVPRQRRLIRERAHA